MNPINWEKVGAAIADIGPRGIDMVPEKVLMESAKEIRVRCRGDNDKVYTVSLYRPSFETVTV